MVFMPAQELISSQTNKELVLFPIQVVQQEIKQWGRNEAPDICIFFLMTIFYS